MAKKKTNKWIIALVIVGFLFVLNQYIPSQSLVCSSNEPSTMQGYLDYFESEGFTCEDDKQNKLCGIDIMTEGYLLPHGFVITEAACNEAGFDDYDSIYKGIPIYKWDGYAFCANNFVLWYTSNHHTESEQYNAFITLLDDYYDEFYTCEDIPEPKSDKPFYESPIVWIIGIFLLLILKGG